MSPLSTTGMTKRTAVSPCDQDSTFTRFPRQPSGASQNHEHLEPHFARALKQNACGVQQPANDPSLDTLNHRDHLPVDGLIDWWALQSESAGE